MQGSGFRLGFRGLGFRVQGLGFRVWGFGFWVSGLGYELIQMPSRCIFRCRIGAQVAIRLRIKILHYLKDPELWELWCLLVFYSLWVVHPKLNPKLPKP